ncbi:MAG: M48 family metallopeptidase [Variovorax sp.]|nr:MAG: M48 family metallopeptidase [Variovorax sp.]
MSAPLLRARWFDGLRSQPRPVLVVLVPGPRGPSLQLHPLDADGGPVRSFAHDAIGWPEAWNARRAQARVVVDLRDAGSLEIDDGAQWHALREAAGGRPGIAQRMQTHLRVFVVVLLAAVLGLWAFYRYGTPWAAAQLAGHVPLGWEQGLSAQAMDELDRSYLQPSKLAPERQAELQAAFRTLVQQAGPDLARYPHYAPVMTLSFRSGIGPNAFALPGGTMVMTDALVEASSLAKTGDDALLGVLAHEMGHVVHRHGTRLVVEQGVLNVGLGLALGDVSSLISMGSTLLTSMAYRRSHETEADCFAVRLMQKAGRPIAPMADLLLTIDGPDGDAHEGPDHGKKNGEKDQNGEKRGGKATEGTTDASALASLLSSHPATAERAQRMKAGTVAGCVAR